MPKVFYEIGTWKLAFKHPLNAKIWRLKNGAFGIYENWPQVNINNMVKRNTEADVVPVFK